MPKEYTDIKSKQLAKGKSKENAESYAAAVYNSKIAPHKKDKRPVGNKAQQKAGTAVSETYTLLRSVIVENNGQIEIIPAGTKIVMESEITEEDKKWMQHAVKHPGRFTEYCKKNGFDGPCEECASHAMKSDDESVRGMASFYRNAKKAKH